MVTLPSQGYALGFCLAVSGCMVVLDLGDPKLERSTAQGGTANSALPNPCLGVGLRCDADMVLAPRPGGGCVCIDRYEASQGSNGGQADCAVSAQPWNLVTLAEARDACVRVGKRLCTGSEWKLACQGGQADRTYPYGSSYDGSACRDWNNGQASNPYVTGSATRCEGGVAGLFDMVGNVAEWTDSGDGTDLATGVVRGGSFASQDQPSCLAESTTAVTSQLIYVGFRCCADGVSSP